MDDITTKYKKLMASCSAETRATIDALLKLQESAKPKAWMPEAGEYVYYLDTAGNVLRDRYTHSGWFVATTNQGNVRPHTDEGEAQLKRIVEQRAALHTMRQWCEENGIRTATDADWANLSVNTYEVFFNYSVEQWRIETLNASRTCFDRPTFIFEDDADRFISECREALDAYAGIK